MKDRLFAVCMDTTLAFPSVHCEVIRPKLLAIEIKERIINKVINAIVLNQRNS